MHVLLTLNSIHHRAVLLLLVDVDVSSRRFPDPVDVASSPSDQPRAEPRVDGDLDGPVSCPASAYHRLPLFLPLNKSARFHRTRFRQRPLNV